MAWSTSPSYTAAAWARINADGPAGYGRGDRHPGFNGESGPANTIRLQNPTGLGFDLAGHLYLADQGNNRVRRVTPDGALTTIAGAAQLNRPADVKVDARGNVYISDMNNHRVLRVDAAGAVSKRWQGPGFRFVAPTAYRPRRVRCPLLPALAVNAAGDVFVVDWDATRSCV
jgi:DNA-binding beta-propeller fold protein YncE